MSVNIGRMLRLLFWTKFIPIRRRKRTPESGGDDSKDGEGWEPDYWSPKFLLLMFISLAVDVTYCTIAFIYFTLSMVASGPSNAANYTVLLFKLLTMTSFIFLPWIYGPAACRLGPLALRPQLIVPVRALVSHLLPGVVFCRGAATKRCRSWNACSIKRCFTLLRKKMPKFRNKYSQKRNIGVSVPISTFMRL
jgi:hypothetical protein